MKLVASPCCSRDKRRTPKLTELGAHKPSIETAGLSGYQPESFLL
jgi:hypothetical protein